ncbi:sulfite exporter TauE/SafE family protein [Duodenibacillus massiliensis]|uniref:sulfite exporter TauE/SafE family protein n=1 Tax=Duodenibacillus massiliensis TaxID=1852381 RepID=UPI003AF612EA
MSLELIAALLVLGACTGYLAGLLGIGGGMVLTPFLTLILSMAGVPDAVVVHAAIATSLSTILFTSLSSVRAHNSRDAVLWKVVLWLAPGILVGAALGAKISSLLPTFWISIAFAAFVGFSALKMFLNAKPKPTRQLPAAPGLFGAGTGIGAVSSLVGAGGGFISVPFMVWCNVPMHKAVGTSAALGFPIAFAGTLSYIWAGWGNPELAGTEHMLGYIHWPALLSVAAMSVLTAPLGAKTAHSIDTKPLKRLFACLLLCLATYMLVRAFI